MLYFDHNATTPVIPEANQTWIKATEEYFGNPSSLHRIGTRADHALERSRHTIASILKCHPLDIIWTSGATEANNLAVFQLRNRLPPEKKIWVSPLEHPSILAPARHYFQNRITWIPVKPTGVVDLDWIQENLKVQSPGAVIAMAANNETGLLQPWKSISELCEGLEIPYLCDAVQWIGKQPAAGLGACTMVSASGHKFGAPKGIGFLKTDGTREFYPLIRGGDQESGRRSGTENIAGAMAITRALEHCEVRFPQGEQLERLRWRGEMIHRLQQELPGIVFIGGDSPTLWNTISCLMPDVGCQFRWVVKLDKAGFAVSTGSACASGSEKPSHVLEAMGLSPEESGRVIRISSSWNTTPADWNVLLKALKKLTQEAPRQTNPRE